MSVNAQGAVPMHPPPLQPVKVELAVLAALSVTCVPVAKLVLQVLPQAMPDGLLVTVPEPVPFLATESVKVGF
jgi:hypothetical protein